MSNDTPAESVRRYRPNDRARPDVAELWPRIGHFAVDMVLATDPPTHVHARAWMTSLGQFLAWLVDSGMWEPESGLPVPLALPVVDHYIQTRTDAKGSFLGGSTIRSQLKRIGLVYAPNLWPYSGATKRRREPRPPYTPAEQRALWDGAERLWRGRSGPAGATVVAAAFGAGLDTPDFRYARGTDVKNTNGGLAVALRTPGRERIVPVADAWADRLAAAAEATGDLFMVGDVDPATKNMMSRVTYQLDRQGPHRLNVPRARTTWLVDRLTAQVPPAVLMKCAGMSSITPIDRALTFVPDVPDAQADALMRSSR